jgi:hypothetical protein
MIKRDIEVALAVFCPLCKLQLTTSEGGWLNGETRNSPDGEYRIYRHLGLHKCDFALKKFRIRREFVEMEEMNEPA